MDKLDDEKRQEMQELVNAEIFNRQVEKVDVQPVTESKSKEIVELLHDTAVVAITKSDEKIQKKFTDQAKKSIHTELDAIDKDIETRRQTATYNANEEACKNYGIDKRVPTWQIQFMKAGSSFWFIIYWIFASLTIAPLNVFFRGIKSFIKQSWLVFFIALLAYLLIVVGIPLLINFVL